MGQYSFARWHLSSVVVCNAPGDVLSRGRQYRLHVWSARWTDHVLIQRRWASGHQRGSVDDRIPDDTVGRVHGRRPQRHLQGLRRSPAGQYIDVIRVCIPGGFNRASCQSCPFPMNY